MTNRWFYLVFVAMIGFVIGIMSERGDFLEATLMGFALVVSMFLHYLFQTSPELNIPFPKHRPEEDNEEPPF